MKVFLLTIVLAKFTGFRTVGVQEFSEAFKTAEDCLKSAQEVKSKYRKKFDIFDVECREESLHNTPITIDFND